MWEANVEEIEFKPKGGNYIRRRVGSSKEHPHVSFQLKIMSNEEVVLPGISVSEHWKLPR